MYELLFLLLPVAAATGWFLARRDFSSRTPSSKDLSSHYFKGLNFLLNEEPDKAIEVFIQMVEVDSETVETHLALGNLFRRRGEVDRAIRIHQNIIARPTLSRTQRALALYELGQDYMRAGLLDRAENLFSELIELGEYRKQSLRMLLEIYEQEKDWERAIDIAQQLLRAGEQPMREVIAQYYCELAQLALNKNDLHLAGKMLKHALASDRQCVRASILQGQIARQEGDCQKAIKCFKQVEQQGADYLPEVLESMEACYRSIDKLDEYAEFLDGIQQRHSGITPMLARSALLKEEQDNRVAAEYIISQLKDRPSVRGLDRLIEYHLERTEGPARDNLHILYGLIKKLLDKRASYKCASCGFEAKSMHWHCPSCKNWNSIKPVQDPVEN